MSLSASNIIPDVSGSGGGGGVNINGIELQSINKSSNSSNLTPKMKRASASKKLQFSNPECSVTPISVIPGSSNRVMAPSRRR